MANGDSVSTGKIPIEHNQGASNGVENYDR